MSCGCDSRNARSYEDWEESLLATVAFASVLLLVACTRSLLLRPVTVSFRDSTSYVAMQALQDAPVRFVGSENLDFSRDTSGKRSTRVKNCCRQETWKYSLILALSDKDSSGLQR
jgi:hypothetical protein